MFAHCNKVTILQLLYYYDALIVGSITIAYIIMTMHIYGIVFSMNIAGGTGGDRVPVSWFETHKSSL